MLIQERLRLLVWALAAAWFPVVMWGRWPASVTLEHLEARWDLDTVAALASVVALTLAAAAIFGRSAWLIRLACAVAGLFFLFVGILSFTVEAPVAGALCVTIFLMSAVSYATIPEGLP